MQGPKAQQSQRSRSLKTLVSGIIVIALLAWGSYAVTYVATTPSGDGAIDNAILSREYSGTVYTGNGTSIPPNTEGRFTIMFQTSVNPKGPFGSWSISGPDYEGIADGPILFKPPTSNFSSFEHQYAVFSYPACGGWAKGPLPPQGQPCPWVTDPQGNKTQQAYGFGYLSPDMLGTAIFEIDSPGNYTLHYFNAQSTNATGKVIMAASLVNFSISRPFLYPGAATLAVTALFLVLNFISNRRKPLGASLPPPASKPIGSTPTVTDQLNPQNTSKTDKRLDQ